MEVVVGGDPSSSLLYFSVFLLSFIFCFLSFLPFVHPQLPYVLFFLSLTMVLAVQVANHS
jgi:hypothetical protein